MAADPWGRFGRLLRRKVVPRQDGGSRAFHEGRVFISYRRSDTAGFAGRLHDGLEDHFGAGRTFRDVVTIKAGADFVLVLEESLGSCGAVVAVIGQEWLTCRKKDGSRRLDDPDDFVRRELEWALERKIPVIPVLVEDAAMPAAADLPEPLAGLARHNALRISDDRWDYDVERLIARLQEIVGSPDRWSLRRRVLTAMVSLLMLVAGVTTLSRGLPLFDRSSAPARMTGDFNIAVARFTGVDRKGRTVDSPEAADLAQSFSDRLQAELPGTQRDGFDLQVRPPGETGRPKGSTPEERAAAAAAMARSISADVIVYGALPTTVPGEFVPEFFVSERKLQGAEEFVGDHPFGSRIPLTDDMSNSVARRDLRDALLGRTQALAQFSDGLHHAALERWPEALESFKRAEASTGWDAGDEILSLFLGNAAMKLGDLASAQRFYDRALTLNPEYSRARIGRAEVLYHRSKGTCGRGGADATGLAKALDTFASANAAADQPRLGDVSTKVAYGRARVHLCMSQAEIGAHWDDAERSFRQVIDEYERGNVRVKTMAAEAHAGIGFLSLPAADQVNAEERLRRSAAEYEKALGLFPRTDREHRRAYFWSMRGFIHGRLGEKDEAEGAYAEAVRLTADDPAARRRYEDDLHALRQRP